MRSLLCWTLRQEIILRAAPDRLTSTIALLSPLKDLSSRRMGPRRPYGVTIYNGLHIALYTHRCQADRTSSNRPGVETPDYPRLSLSRMLLDGPDGSAEKIELAILLSPESSVAGKLQLAVRKTPGRRQRP
jgi:hypothetical protein